MSKMMQSSFAAKAALIAMFLCLAVAVHAIANAGWGICDNADRHTDNRPYGRFDDAQRASCQPGSINLSVMGTGGGVNFGAYDCDTSFKFRSDTGYRCGDTNTARGRDCRTLTNYITVTQYTAGGCKTLPASKDFQTQQERDAYEQGLSQASGRCDSPKVFGSADEDSADAKDCG